MGWSHGTRWTPEMVRAELLAIGEKLGRMPTANELRAGGHNSLACAVPHYGGYHVLAAELGLEEKGTETHFGQRWERSTVGFYEGRGANVGRMSTRHPFDMLINGHRVDVKAARRSQHGFAFAGLKLGAHCDFFHLVCVGDDGKPLARFIVPAEHARVHVITISPKTLAGRGKYAPFRDAFAPLMEAKAA